MFIKKVELENIKSHIKSSYEFEKGTTAITGTNGAGKTTILEAIAWAIFGFLDYNKADFVTRGQKKGSVTITIETSDQKQYLIYRDTGSGYYIYDPAIKTKLYDQREEIAEFLRRILQVEAGTDLKELFQTAIGVPQGTFTADFLLSRELRKKKFDKLLKVEEYRNSAEKLKGTVKLIEARRLEVWERIVRSETQLERFDEISAEHKSYKEKEISLNKDISSLKENLGIAEKGLAAFNELKQKADQTLQMISKLEFQINEANRRIAEKETQLEESKSASLRQKEVESDHLLFQASSENLKKLQSEQNKRLELQNEQAKIDGDLRGIEIELKNLNENLEKAEKAKKEIESLSGQIEEYKALELKAKEISEKLTIARDADKRLKNLASDLDKLRSDFRSSKQNIEALEKESADIGQRLALLNFEGAKPEIIESKKSEVTHALANLKAAIEKDMQFEREVKNGLCPILSQKCLNIGEDENLESYFKNAFSQNSGKVNELTSEQEILEKALLLARESEKHQQRIENALQIHEQITENGKRLNKEEAELKEAAEKLPEIEEEFRELDGKLKALGNPDERGKLLKAEAEKESLWGLKIEESEKKAKGLDAEKAKILTKLKAFENLDGELKKAQAELDKTQAAQRIFLELQGIANLLVQREGELADSKKELEDFSKELEKAKKDNADILSKYDQEKHQEKQAEFDALRRNEAILETELRQITENIKNRELEIAKLEGIRAKLADEKEAEAKLKKTREATEFISDTLKKAAPEVAKMLLARISHEANLFFREITDNAEWTLSWRDDYEIILEELGENRPFYTLSGGEQMSAALSVRLAILQELSDIRFAFFDEPTVNMDIERREKLALAINGISQRLRFSQIFVISHDDTFASHTHYEVRIEK